MTSSALRTRLHLVATRSLVATAVMAGTASLAAPAHAADQPATSSAASTPADRTFGMPAPATPESATSDASMTAWVIKNGTEEDRRAMATDMGVAYPADASLLGATCDKGKGYVAVWVINFGTKQARWNLTLDGKGYAGASVLPRSHDYGAIGVPNGKHTVKIVDPATGRVAASLKTNLSCGVKAPAASKPAHPVTGKHTSTTKPPHAKPAPVKPATVVSPGAHTHPAKPSRGSAVAGPEGPKVQADLIQTAGGSTPSTGLVAALFAAVAGSVVFARRMMRG